MKIDRLKEIIAICLFFLGKKPNATLFIDEETIMYGYGRCHSVGVFEYNLPYKYVKAKRDKHKLKAISMVQYEQGTKKNA